MHPKLTYFEIRFSIPLNETLDSRGRGNTAFIRRLVYASGFGDSCKDIFTYQKAID